MTHDSGNFTVPVNGIITGRRHLVPRSIYRGMLEGLIERIERRLAAVELSAAEASRMAGLSPDAIRNIKRASKSGDKRLGVSTHTLSALAPVLRTTVGWLLSEDGLEETPPSDSQLAAPTPPRRRRGDVIQAKVAVPAPEAMPRDLPVIGRAAAAALPDGLPKSARDPILLDPSQPVDEVGRPPGLIGAPDAYAVWVIGDSMSPAHPTGELRVAHPHRPVRAGDAVIIQVREREGGPLFGFIKTFVGRTEQFVVAEQLNPRAVIRFKASTVVAVHRVLTYGELLGISR